MTYLEQIEDLEYYPMRDYPDVWVSMEYEGLNEEYDEGNFLDNWVVGFLKISEKDKEGLIKLDTETVEKFNDFDIELKEKYNLKIIDLIDYNIGRVLIVKYLK